MKSFCLVLLVFGISVGYVITKDIQFGALRNDIGYNFFDEAEQLFDISLNNSIKFFSRSGFNNDLCLNHLKRLKEGIYDYQEWALEWPDSWGKPPVGLFWGHTISMGGYEECIDASHQFTETDLLRGHYCLAQIPIQNFISKVKPRPELQMNARISYKQKDPEYFELGICMPNSCSPEMIDQIFKEYLKKITGFYETEKIIRSDFCKLDEKIELRGIDIFAIVFFSVIILIIILSSIHDYNKKKRGVKANPISTAFSLLTNVPKIFTVTPSNSPNVINCLSGLRCICMMWVVFGHNYMTIYNLPHINRNKFYTWTETPYSMLVQNASLCVDTFFFMSGLLMLWGAFREMEKSKGRLNLLMMYFHRYIRLTPVVAVVILYISSLYKYSGAGPMWMKTGTQDKICEETWWATLLYVQNYVFPNRMCISQSWYLAVDTQLYFFSPLFLIPLWKWGKKAVAPIIIVGIFCLASTFTTFMLNDFALFRVKDDNVDLRQRLTYYPTHTRLPTWLCGVVFGYFLYTKNRGKQIPLAKKWVILGWIISFGVLIGDIWGPYWRILPETPDPPLIEGALYEPLSRISWALSIAWIVWACYNGHGGIINDFLSWSFFIGFSRLTYCMYVTHRIIQLVNAARLQHDTHFSDYDALQRFWHDFGISLMVSIFATLAFEAPILGIEKAIFGRSSSKSVPQTHPIVVVEPNQASRN